MKITLPLSVTIPRKTKEDKVFSLNLNVYRNANFHILNDAKVAYKNIVVAAVIDSTGKINQMIGNPPYIFIYTIYPPNNRKFDIGNVLPICQKFTDDALIELGIIPDDSYKFIKANLHKFGYVDKEDPRIELEIFEECYFNYNTLPF